MAEYNEQAWHLDKKVPLAMIFAIAMQTALGVWWAAGLAASVTQIAVVNDAQDARLGRVEQTTQAQAVTAASITAQISAMRDTLEQVREDQRETNSLLRQALGQKP